MRLSTGNAPSAALRGLHAAKAATSSSSTRAAFSSTPSRTPVRRQSGGANANNALGRPAFLRPLSSLAAAANNGPRKTQAQVAQNAHAQLQHKRRGIASSQVAQIERSSVVEAEGDMATTQDHVVIDYPEEAARDPDDYGHNTIGPGVGRHRSRTLESLSLNGKVCVVTGAARGLGNLMARTLVESGANALAIIDLDAENSKKAAEDVTEWFEKHGGAKKGEVQTIGIGCDVSNEESVKAAMQQVVDKFGHIDVMVNSAGIVHNYPATEYPSDKMRQLYGINIDGSFFCAREAAKHMLAQDRPGSIVFIGSMSGSIVNIPQPQTPYNASKAAVKHMASSLAVEWARKNIRVNSIAPGYMVTSLTRTILDANPDLEATWTSLTPMGRLGAPEDLKGAIVFLASDSSEFVTGTELKVDGGYCCT